MRISDARTTETWKMDDFLQKLKKVLISQSDYRKAGQYQLPYISCRTIPMNNDTAAIMTFR